MGNGTWLRVRPLFGEFLTFVKVVLYLASNYSLKDEVCIDPVELLHQLWSGISKIFRQKARRAEILNEIIFNVTDLFSLQKIKTEILKVCLTHFWAHMTLLSGSKFRFRPWFESWSLYRTFSRPRKINRRAKSDSWAYSKWYYWVTSKLAWWRFYKGKLSIIIAEIRCYDWW